MTLEGNNDTFLLPGTVEEIESSRGRLDALVDSGGGGGLREKYREFVPKFVQSPHDLILDAEVYATDPVSAEMLFTDDGRSRVISYCCGGDPAWCRDEA